MQTLWRCLTNVQIIVANFYHSDRHLILWHSKELQYFAQTKLGEVTCQRWMLTVSRLF